MDLVFFGIQGSGKGTQTKIFAEKIKAKIFEAGAELRQIAAENSELGNKIRDIINSGKLVPTEVVMEVCENFINKKCRTSDKIIFDGIPRSMEQKIIFDQILKKNNRDFCGVLIDLSEQEAINRLLKRRICEKCKKVFSVDFSEENCEVCGEKLIQRSDDNEKSILVRLENFKKETVPVIEEVAEQKKLIKINGNQEILKVAEDLFLKLKEI